MAEPFVQVPVSLIERARDAIDAPDTRRADIRAELAAALSQPGPSAEPEHDESCVIWTGDGFTCDCGNDDASRTEPPRIADMVPGTTFTARKGRGPEQQMMRLRDGWVIGTDGRQCDATVIDPSTIRDVTPPPATPGATS